MSSFQLYRLANAASDLTGDGKTTADNNDQTNKNIDKNSVNNNNKNRLTEAIVSGFRGASSLHHRGSIIHSSFIRPSSYRQRRINHA